MNLPPIPTRSERPMRSVSVTPVSRKNRPKYPRKLSPLGALKVLDEAHGTNEWETTIRAAMEKSGGSVPDAAGELDISTRRLFKILQDRRFKDVVRKPMGKPPSRGGGVKSKPLTEQQSKLLLRIAEENGGWTSIGATRMRYARVLEREGLVHLNTFRLTAAATPAGLLLAAKLSEKTS